MTRHREVTENSHLLFDCFGSGWSSGASTLPGGRLQCGNSVWRFGWSRCRRHVVCRRSLKDRQGKPCFSGTSDQNNLEKNKGYIKGVSYLCWRPERVEEKELVLGLKRTDMCGKGWKLFDGSIIMSKYLNWRNQTNMKDGLSHMWSYEGSLYPKHHIVCPMHTQSSDANNCSKYWSTSTNFGSKPFIYQLILHVRMGTHMWWLTAHQNMCLWQSSDRWSHQCTHFHMWTYSYSSCGA